jgi:putative DNA primase/helicase
MYYIESGGYAEKYGIDKATLEQMVKAVIKENEKKAREDRGESQRAEKQKGIAKRESEREQKRKEREEERKAREEERRTREAGRRADRKEADKQRTFEMTIRLPSILHDGKLKELAKRIDEDVEILRVEFTAFAEEGKSEIVGDAQWPDPVNTKALLTEVMAQLLRYIVVKEEQAVAKALWIMFAWLHKNIAVHSPMLAFRSAEIDSGKTTACGVLKFLTPRAYTAGEMTGPSLYRFVDRVHPTLIIDDADKLLPRKPDLAHVINMGWTRGTLIPRVGPYGEPIWFNPFCPKVIAGANLLLPKAAASRTIVIKLLPKLPGEKVEDFAHIDDERILTLRRKLARWSIDNAAALREAKPELPPGFNNRLAMNWRLQLAIADLAGADWPKKARAAAVKIDDTQEELSEGVRALAALASVYAHTAQEEITSEEAVKALNADPTGEWCEFRNRGPITQRQLAALLNRYDIRPVVMHPTKRSGLSRHGYKLAQFTDTFARYLRNDPNIRTLQKRKKK